MWVIPTSHKPDPRRGNTVDNSVFSLFSSRDKHTHFTLDSYPNPVHLSITCCTDKQERTWYLFLYEWRRDRKDGRKGLIVCGHTGLKFAKRAKVPGKLPQVHVSTCRRLSTHQALSMLNNTWKAVCSANLRHFLITLSHVRQDLCFSLLQAMEAGWGLGTRLTSHLINSRCCYQKHEQ